MLTCNSTIFSSFCITSVHKMKQTSVKQQIIQGLDDTTNIIMICSDGEDYLKQGVIRSPGHIFREVRHSFLLLAIILTDLQSEIHQRVFQIEPTYQKQGNSVARDLPRTSSETKTTIFVIYILDIDSHCPYLLSGETTFQLTSC